MVHSNEANGKLFGWITTEIFFWLYFLIISMQKFHSRCSRYMYLYTYHNHLIAFHSVMKMKVNSWSKIEFLILFYLNFNTFPHQNEVFYGYQMLVSTKLPCHGNHFHDIWIIRNSQISILWFLDLSATFMNLHYIFLAQCDISLLIDITFLLRNFQFSTP